MQCLYKTLDLLPSATDNEIRSAYRRRALSTHPDKGGSAEAFRSVVSAFETLIDASKRAAYDKLRLRPRAPPSRDSRTVKTARQHACPTPKKRAAEPRPPPTKPPKVPEAPKPATNSPAMESDPVDHRQLFRRLLGMPRKKALKELEQLSEETLNAFAEFLDSEEAEQILCEPLVLALKDLPKPRKPRKPKARKKKSEKITKAKQKQPVNTDTPSAATAGAARPLLKGISRNRRDGSYQARICFNNFMTCAQYVNNLDVAVDIHISLVQMRQHAAASLAEGKEFGQVMHDAIEAIQKERATAGAVKLRLRFRSFFRNKFTRTEGNLDKAIQDWTRVRQEKDSFAGRVRGMEAERKQDETQKREARAARAAARMERLRQMSERREAKLMARQRRQEALRRKRLAYARVKHGNLRTMILVLQTRFQKIRRKNMLKDWGVPELPEGLQLNSFQSADDSLCATLRLSDGTDAVGPYRKNFQEALRELQELRALQQLRGDKVLCQEMQRRDLEAMTAFFVQSIR